MKLITASTSRRAQDPQTRNTGRRGMATTTSNNVSRLILLMRAATAIAAVTLTALAQRPTPDPGRGPTDPSRDCWNGVLQYEIPHCYLFEEAENDGKIKIESIYLEPSGALCIFLSRTEPIDEELVKYFEAKAHQYVEKKTQEFLEDAADGSYSMILHDWVDHQGTCTGQTGEERRHCYNNILADGSITPLWWAFDHQPGAFPEPFEYKNIFMHVGGTEARKNVASWASWRQLWPTEEEETTTDSFEFDLSNIDTTKLPKPVCDDVYQYSNDHMATSCRSWERHPELGVGATHVRDEGHGVGTLFHHITSPIPTDEEELEALKQKLGPGYDEYGWKMELLPAKYDFGQLWQWKTLLERFILSETNTIGLLTVELNTNGHFERESEDIQLWVGGNKPAGPDKFFGIGLDFDELRNILVLGATDHYKVADALPHLLPRLGIPLDAVGLVIHKDRSPLRVYLLKEENEAPITVQNTPGDTGQDGSATNQQENLAPRSPRTEQVKEPNTSDNLETGSRNSSEIKDSPPVMQVAKKTVNTSATSKREVSVSVQPTSAASQPQDQQRDASPPQAGRTAENRPDSPETSNNPALSAKENPQWTVIAIAVLAGLIGLGLVILLGFRVTGRRSSP